MNEVIQEIEHDDNCFWGYVGVFLGGIVGAIPYVAIWYYFNLKLAILTALIPIVSITGYRYFKGVFNKNTFKAIIISSVIILPCISTFFPDIYLQKFNINFQEYNKYRILLEKQNFDSDYWCLAIGILISYFRIQNILNRYKATNNTIKDMGMFAEKDNSPIMSSDDKSEPKVENVFYNYNAVDLPSRKNGVNNYNTIVKPGLGNYTLNNNINRKRIEEDNRKAIASSIRLVIVLFVIFPIIFMTIIAILGITVIQNDVKQETIVYNDESSYDDDDDDYFYNMHIENDY